LRVFQGRVQPDGVAQRSHGLVGMVGGGQRAGVIQEHAGVGHAQLGGLREMAHGFLVVPFAPGEPPQGSLHLPVPRKIARYLAVHFGGPIGFAEIIGQHFRQSQPRRRRRVRLDLRQRHFR